MENVTLNNGVEMPILGFGVYQVPPDETEEAVTNALAAGYRSLDTAAAYQNEAAVGRAVQKSGLARNELFITTKLWIQDNGEATTTRAFEASLQNLGTEYVDLYLIHQPFGDVYGEWRVMEQLYSDGAARAIGVSNFAPDRLVDLVIHHDVVPAVNQIETNPFYQRAVENQLMSDRGIRHESWAPFAEGKNNLFSDPTLSAVGEAHGKSIPQVVLRWLIQRGIVVIPKSVRPDRMAENFDVFDFELSPQEMAAIADLDTGKSMFFDHRDPEAVARLSGVTLE
ncbi:MULTISPECIES: aldo/keto reductase [unclassified Arthrobacter]|uniref:aldo/keto reductase n=1 Tax=unclassified Arthrobacter TaxID=235627 RepID=UPI0021025FC7|nr:MULTISPECIES: aldo/keto reductase [unclassified Arthrobacter]MCQ1946113.1 aldo/keto reductase [Arthrobacter sp. zg-Y1116]MCQ1986051.1 aldo/keto reductase [Arthrobacter sp. zg-Y844]MCQ1994206.1 aldo/keto reductase [Arthrobacter sp. zg-Y1171]UWX81694.1 aldo/keto reductase [Arthrobacter sp. zg-Y1171]